MIFLSHLKIGSILYKNISQVYGIKLNKAAFLFGNIFPDIDLKVCRNRHNMEDCIYEIEQYKGCKIRSKLRKSFRLGIVCHYVSDSFCAAHLLTDVYNTRDKHLTYEMHRCLNFDREMEKLHVEKLLPLAGGIGQYREHIQQCAELKADSVAACECENIFKYCMMIMGLLLAE